MWNNNVAAGKTVHGVVTSRTIDILCDLQRTSSTTEELHTLLLQPMPSFILLNLHCQRCARTLCWSWCHSALQTPCVCESILHCALLACRYLWQRVTTVSRMVKGDRNFHSLKSMEVSFISCLSRGLSRKDMDCWRCHTALCFGKQGKSSSAF